MILKNYMEEIVFNLIDVVLTGMDMCKCKKCTMDIAAIALNNLPTKYVVTDKGELYTKVDILKTQVEVDAITAITQAARVVSRNPHH